ncbi:MAG: hypothetical protein WAJ93_08355 [Candidatus Nitrosopolaris sp.]
MNDEFKCKDKFIIDNQNFLSMTCSPEDIALSEYDLTPQDCTMEIGSGEEVIMLGGWKFNVSRVIYANATVNDILDGWNNLLHENIPVDILFLCLFIRTIFDRDKPESLGQQPELVALLKLCYWYHRCIKMRSNIAFNNKIAEITDEFGLSTQAEKFGLPIRANFGNDTKRYLEELQPILLAIAKRKAPRGFTDMLWRIRHSVWRFKSEYLFYSLADEAGFTISIIKNNKLQKTPDVILNTIPAEVKTILDKMEYQEKIESSVFEEILASFNKSKIFKKINEGLSQGSKIIILDATTTSLGYIVSYYVSTHKITPSTHLLWLQLSSQPCTEQRFHYCKLYSTISEHSSILLLKSNTDEIK